MLDDNKYSEKAGRLLQFNNTDGMVAAQENNFKKLTLQ